VQWRCGYGRGWHDDCRKTLGVAILPEGAGCRGNRGGEADDLEVLRLCGDCSPELCLRTVRFNRGQARRPGAHGDRKISQGGVQRQQGGTGAVKGVRESRSSLESSKFAASSGGATSSHWCSLAALGFGKERGNREGVLGFL
jgi:hypothetical protein